MLEEPAAQENPFEPVPYQGALVPRLLLAEGREGDLGEYLAGWKDQGENRSTPAAPGIAYSWHDAGSAARWKLSDVAVSGSSVGEGERELDLVMSHMRENTLAIPRSAWSQEDFGSDARTDDHPASR